MIRDRLKRVARKAAIKILNMEFDTEERDPRARGNHDASRFDPDKIPRVVDGDGDTPGPNHKEDIGRPWVSAQLAGGVAPFFLDIRPPQECVAGTLPGALVLPGELIKQHLDRLPAKTERVTVYDQTGELGSAELAAWLREQGWAFARRLRGGYAEWIEHGEPVVPPSAPAGARHKLGDPLRLPGGGEAWVLEVRVEGGSSRTLAWKRDGSTAGPFSDQELEG